MTKHHLQHHSYIRWLLWITILCSIALMLWLLLPILTPFIAAFIFAYILAPAVKILQKKPWIPRALVVLIVEIIFVFALAMVITLVIPIFSDLLPKLQRHIPLIIDNLSSSFPHLSERFGLDLSNNGSYLHTWIFQLLGRNSNEILNALYQSIKSGSSIAITVITNLILIPILLFYCLMDWPRILAYFQQWIPPKFHDNLSSFFQEISLSMNQFIRGQLLVMTCLAIYYAAGLSIIGLDLGLPIGVFTGLLVCIPYMGYGMGLLLALLSAWLQLPPSDVSMWIGIVIVFGLGQVTESFYLTPRLVGGRIGLSPLAVIFALFAFGQLFGFVGVLLAIPLCAIGLALGRHLKRAYQNSTLYNE